MGYRLYVRVSDNPVYYEWMELGKQYAPEWDEFNKKWFGIEDGRGDIFYIDAKEFYDELIEVNNRVLQTKYSDYDLYNLDILEDMVKETIREKQFLEFKSY